MSIDAYIESLNEVKEKQAELIAAQKEQIAAQRRFIEKLKEINDELIVENVLLRTMLSKKESL